MRLIPPLRLAIVTAALGLTACDPGTTNGDGGAGHLSISIPVRLSGSTVAAQQRVQSGGDVDRFHVRIVVKRTGESVLDRSVTESEVQTGESDPVLTVNFRIPAGAETEVFTLTIDGLLGAVRNYSIGPVDFQLGADGRSATVNAQAIYVGPGSDVTGVLLSPRTISVGVNQTVPFSCVGTPGNVTNFPYEVETANPQIASVTNATTIRGGTVGITELVCRLTFGSHAEDRIPVTVTGGGPTITVVSGGNQTALAGTALPNPVVVQVRAGDGLFLAGTTVTFTPNVGHGTAQPATAVTNSQGQATTAWTLGPNTGPQTLRASATVQGLPISIDIPATASGTGNSGSIIGTVQSNQGVPISGATLELRSGSNNTSGTPLGTTTSASNGSFTFGSLAAGSYTVRGHASGFSDGSTTVTVTSGASVSATVVLTQSGTGAVAGTVTNAQTGLALSGATVEIRSGTGVTTGTPLATTTTSANGAFSFQNRVAGPYTVRAFASGFAEAFVNVTVVANQNANAPLSLSPVQGAGQIRIVVTWGNVLDLDSHLSVPQGAGGTGTPILVFWNSPYTNSSGCSLSTNPFACLEHDAVPPSDLPTESTRIGTVLAGTYRFFVHNYTADSEERAASDNSLATSGVRVDVYVGSSTTAAASFTPPAGSGNLWAAFTMQLNGTTPVFSPVTVNALTQVDFAQPPPGSAGATSAGSSRTKGPIRR
jgi:hypothetical protein